MTREDALRDLVEGTSHQRFQAVRALKCLAASADIPLLLQIKSSEQDFYVKKRLEMLIRALGQEEETAQQTDDVIPVDVRQRLRSEAIEWVAGLLLHEIGSKIGLLASDISREVPGYDISNSKRRIESLQDTFDGIEELKKATAVPRPIEMDLASFIEDMIALENASKGVEISLVGRRPLVIFSDRNILGLALSNGIKNAIEAAMLVVANRVPSIVINWGTTDIDCWVSIIDNGPGLPSESVRTFGLGESSKGGHLGFGLGIAKQAIETLRGSVSLRNSEASGAVYELRWSLVV